MDLALISKLEKLARLHLSDSERTRFAADLDRILAMIEALQRLDTRQAEPLVYLNDTADGLREDVADGSGTLGAEKTFQNAPDHDSRFFRVPKMID